MKRLKSTAFMVILLVIAISQVGQANSFYLHENENFWWYMPENPKFSAVVPSNADRYLETKVFGQPVLQMFFRDNTIIMEVGSVKGSDVDTVRDSLIARYRPVVPNRNVFANREITTSNGLNAFFYGYEGRGAHGNQVMMRTVYFERNDVIVYLAMFLDSNRYQGALQDYWLRAVNEFEW